jgi:hypothetical protein
MEKLLWEHPIRYRLATNEHAFGRTVGLQQFPIFQDIRMVQQQAYQGMEMLLWGPAQWGHPNRRFGGTME